jgi:hypothetical protein
MITKKTWKEFRETGLLLIVNQFLHIFGWAIAFEIDQDTGEVTSVYPVRTKFRGFDNDSVTEAYKKVTNHLSETINELKEETK